MTAPKPSIVPPVIIRIENAVAAATSIAFEKGKWVCAVVVGQARRTGHSASAILFAFSRGMNAISVLLTL
jgi:hypothetical protein